MCELFAVSGNSIEINKLALSILTAVTGESNKDGYGIYQDHLMKTEVQGSRCSNLGMLLHGVITTPDIAIGHTRLASAANRVNGITKENAHPFEYDKFVIAHNGTLTMDEEKLKLAGHDTKELIDSRIFGLELEKHWSDDIVKSLNETMQDFTGKFAFMLCNKETKTYYAVRGLTAHLHISYLIIDDKRIGYVINTEKNDLFDSLILLTNIYQVVRRKNLVFTEAVELNTETCYRLDKYDVVEVGKVNERVKPVTTSITQYGGVYGGRYAGRYAGSYGWEEYLPEAPVNHSTALSTVQPQKGIVKDFIDYATGFMSRNRISYEDLEEILYHSAGLTLLELNKESLPPIMEILKKLDVMSSKRARKLWFRYMELNKDKSTWYETLQFPYMVNSLIALEKAVNTRKETKIDTSK